MNFRYGLSAALVMVGFLCAGLALFRTISADAALFGAGVGILCGLSAVLPAVWFRTLRDPYALYATIVTLLLIWLTPCVLLYVLARMLAP